METFTQLDISLTLWINHLVGRVPVADLVASYIVNDYMIPTLMSLILLALWFSSPHVILRFAKQQAVFVALLAVAFGNLITLILNNYIFRPRPFVEHTVNLVFYQPTDSSFPSNPAVVAFALAHGIWLANRKIGVLAYFLATIWGLSRIYAGVSYTSDVIIGATIGTSVAIVVAVILSRIERLTKLVLNIARYVHIA